MTAVPSWWTWSEPAAGPAPPAGGAPWTAPGRCRCCLWEQNREKGMDPQTGREKRKRRTRTGDEGKERRMGQQLEWVEIVQQLKGKKEGNEFMHSTGRQVRKTCQWKGGKWRVTNKGVKKKKNWTGSTFCKVTKALNPKKNWILNKILIWTHKLMSACHWSPVHICYEEALHNCFILFQVKQIFKLFHTYHLLKKRKRGGEG